MRGVLWQRWICVEGVANQGAFQRVGDWFDMSPYQAVVPFVEIANISGAGATLTLQTGPTADVSTGGATVWQKLVDGSGNGATFTTTGVQTLRAYRYSDGQLPPAALLRWWLSGTAAWSITFRIALGLLEARMGAQPAA